MSTRRGRCRLRFSDIRPRLRVETEAGTGPYPEVSMRQRLLERLSFAARERHPAARAPFASGACGHPAHPGEAERFGAVVQRNAEHDDVRRHRSGGWHRCGHDAPSGRWLHRGRRVHQLHGDDRLEVREPPDVRHIRHPDVVPLQLHSGHHLPLQGRGGPSGRADSLEVRVAADGRGADTHAADRAGPRRTSSTRLPVPRIPPTPTT